MVSAATSTSSSNASAPSAPLMSPFIGVAIDATSPGPFLEGVPVRGRRPGSLPGPLSARLRARIRSASVEHADAFALVPGAAAAAALASHGCVPGCVPVSVKHLSGNPVGIVVTKSAERRASPAPGPSHHQHHRRPRVRSLEFLGSVTTSMSSRRRSVEQTYNAATRLAGGVGGRQSSWGGAHAAAGGGGSIASTAAAPNKPMRLASALRDTLRALRRSSLVRTATVAPAPPPADPASTIDQKLTLLWKPTVDRRLTHEFIPPAHRVLCRSSSRESSSSSLAGVIAGAAAAPSERHVGESAPPARGSPQCVEGHSHGRSFDSAEQAPPSSDGKRRSVETSLFSLEVPCSLPRSTLLTVPHGAGATVAWPE
jgi:hypothetical protein